MTERWRPIPGFEGEYEVSDLGQVRSLDRTIVVPRKNGTYQKRLKGRVLSPAPYRGGYLHLSLGKGPSRAVHRLVLLAFVGPPPPGQEGCHYNGVRTDNRLDNLRWDTRSGNMQDAIASGSYFSEKRKAHLKKFAELGREQLTEKHRLSGGRRIYGN